MSPLISQAAVDLIVSAEISSKATYERSYRHPEWPGGASGITVAIGYDLGYCSLAKLHADWDGRLAAGMVRVMERCLGVRGAAASALLPSVRQLIDVPWDKAMEVFLDRDVPQWTDAVVKAIPAATKLSPDSLGALVSLAYNRGASFSTAGDRYREMRDIKTHTTDGRPDLDPADIRSMKRLWPGVHGLLVRRDAEAALFERGLLAKAKAPEAHAATETPAPLPQPQAGKAEAGSSVVSGAGAAGAIYQSSGFVWSWFDVFLLAGGAISAAVIVYLAVRWYRTSQPVVAREKDHPAQTQPA